METPSALQLNFIPIYVDFKCNLAVQKAGAWEVRLHSKKKVEIVFVFAYDTWENNVAS